ncbi:DUF4192 domain-containing protein [Nocardioides seonyuensis]|uniref:DUF4192 domain-containing protein n=2 Tax=Nocardioides seonyuensis TaxID=2518371 RepID=A0A4P7IKJ3_9ACTN|nr:DUF4192 domain-containing protein [Nocardioides seonyuensis]
MPASPGSVLPMNSNPFPAHDQQHESRTGPGPLVVKRPEDLLAFVPLAIGFTPERSVVMLTFDGRGSSFHARVDLPAEIDDVDDLVETLLAPARRHRVSSVIFVIYDDDTVVADESAWSLHESFGAAGIAVTDVLRAHEGMWFAVLPGRPREHYAGVSFDVSTHPFTARGVFEGRVTHRSREDLRASLAPRPDEVEETVAALCTAAPLPESEVRALVLGALHGDPLAAPDLARLALALASPSARDEAWSWLTRSQARAAADLWSDVVRRVPTTHVAAPAAVLAMAAWLAGEGALAWCAVDRCREVEPQHSLATLVAGLLESAASPEVWHELRPDPAA